MLLLISLSVALVTCFVVCFVVVCKDMASPMEYLPISDILGMINPITQIETGWSISKTDIPAH